MTNQQIIQLAEKWIERERSQRKSETDGRGRVMVHGTLHSEATKQCRLELLEVSGIMSPIEFVASPEIRRPQGQSLPLLRPARNLRIRHLRTLVRLAVYQETQLMNQPSQPRVKKVKDQEIYK